MRKHLTGREIMTLFTLVVVMLSIYATLMTKEIPSSVVTLYLGALGGFVTNRTMQDMRSSKEKEGDRQASE